MDDLARFKVDKKAFLASPQLQEDYAEMVGFNYYNNIQEFADLYQDARIELNNDDIIHELKSKNLLYFRSKCTEKKLTLAFMYPETGMFNLNIEFDNLIIIGKDIYDSTVGSVDGEIFSSEEIRLATSDNPADQKKVNRDKLLQKVFGYQVSNKFPDMHFTPYGDQLYRITVRTNTGELKFLHNEINKEFVELLIKGMKNHANLDTYEKVVETKRKMSLDIAGHGKSEFRLSILLGIGGERAVLRRLPSQDEVEKSLTLEKLNFQPEHIELLRMMIADKRGMVWFGGETGSGKSMSLASMIVEHGRAGDSVLTIEDPCEINLSSYGVIFQIDLSETAGAREDLQMTIKRATTASLRQDPDVVLIQECRTHQDAVVAYEIPMQGHKSYSTMHAHDCAGMMLRLTHPTMMAVDPVVVASTTKGLCHMELRPMICQVCEGRGFLRSEAELCTSCRSSGYSGRIPIPEIVYFDRIPMDTEPTQMLQYAKHYISRADSAKMLYKRKLIDKKTYNEFCKDEI